MDRYVSFNYIVAAREALNTVGVAACGSTALATAAVAGYLRVRPTNPHGLAKTAPNFFGKIGLVRSTTEKA